MVRPGSRDVTLTWLLWVAFSRWPIERCFQQAKDELGMDHFEVRDHKHMNILPELYPVWLDSWIKTVAELVPQWDSKLDTMWRSQLQACIDSMKSHHVA